MATNTDCCGTSERDCLYETVACCSKCEHKFPV